MMVLFYVNQFEMVCYATIENPDAKYSHTLVLAGFRTCQTLYTSHFNEKKTFQQSALA